MAEPLDLPPHFTVGPSSVGVSVITLQGAKVHVVLPKPRGLSEVSRDELIERATKLAAAALQSAADALAG